MNQKRAKIINAAQALFLKVGLRAATMEAIAREAGVAKPTLYKYFADKEAVFAGVAADLALRMRDICSTALNSDATDVARIVNVLSTKHAFVFRLLEGSPHASELYMAGKIGVISEFEAWLASEIGKLLIHSRVDDPARIGHLLIACSAGIADHATHVEEIGPAVRFMVERLAPPTD